MTLLPLTDHDFIAQQHALELSPRASGKEAATLISALTTLVAAGFILAVTFLT